MNDVLPQEVEHPVVEYPANHISYLDELFGKAAAIFRQHRLEDPDLYQMIEQQKAIKEAKEKKAIISTAVISNEVTNAAKLPQLVESIYFKQFKQKELIAKIRESHQNIHDHHVETQSLIIPRTQSRNIKQPYSNIEEMTADREDKLSSQIQAWRSILPILINRFSKIHDPRRAKSVKHKVAAIMTYGLLAFIFRLSSRREINRELSGVVVFENMKKIFPELESIPHADTLARLLEKINIKEIEKTHILLINKLIRNKKFKKSLVSG